ncbi:MAG: hypothetical protein ABSC48_01705 [Terracidiphilus sp.]|jgi:hypothetical protein
MSYKPEFEQIREEIEAKQRSILWPDGLRAGKSVDEFLWKGDPKAKPIQRAGLIVFAVTYWLLGVLMIAICWARANDEWAARFLGSLIGAAFVLVSIRLFLNAFLRPEKPDKNEKDVLE